MQPINRHAIVACATPAWLAPAAVTLWSCAKHGAAQRADLAIVCHNPSARDAEDLARFNALRGTDIRLLPVDATGLARPDSGWGVGTLLRLKLDEYLPPDYERVLYVDADVLALHDIAEIFSIGMEGHALAAVPDVGSCMSRRTMRHVRRLNLPAHAAYFNAGVMLFDWQRTRASRYLPRALELLLSGRNWPLLDQDVLNIASGGQWKKLPLRWNAQQWLAQYLGVEVEAVARLRHFVGRHKPWNSPQEPACRSARAIYADCLTGTPWEWILDTNQVDWSLASRLHWLRQRCRLFRRARMNVLLHS
ncbi:MAG TPA: glycosyltransferase family 8 protein [Steroidobacteraceae bacterium]|nr:glycosyltransferase family 8 protein [Steroidobacteraceae bacterium]